MLLAYFHQLHGVSLLAGMTIDQRPLHPQNVEIDLRGVAVIKFLAIFTHQVNGADIPAQDGTRILFAISKRPIT
ncbi:hypothetical protein ACNKHL_20275 [Shigella flexneri]